MLSSLASLPCRAAARRPYNLVARIGEASPLPVLAARQRSDWRPHVTVGAGRAFSSSSSESSPGGAGGAFPPNPMHIIEQIQETAQKVGAQAGLPTTLDEAQSKLHELKGTIEERLPGTASIQDVQTALELNPEKLVQATLPFITAGTILMRARGTISEEQEEKLSQVLPAPAVAAIKEVVPVIPKDPQVELLEAVLDRLEAIQGEINELKAASESKAAAEDQQQTTPPPN